MLLVIDEVVVIEQIFPTGHDSNAPGAIANDILIKPIGIGEVHPDSTIRICLHQVVTDGVVITGQQRYAELIVSRCVISGDLIRARSVKEEAAVLVVLQAVVRYVISIRHQHTHAEASGYIILEDSVSLAVIEEDGIIGYLSLFYGDVLAVCHGEVGDLSILYLPTGEIEEIDYGQRVDCIGFVYGIVVALFCLGLGVKAPCHIVQYIFREPIGWGFHKNYASGAVFYLIAEEAVIAGVDNLNSSIFNAPDNIIGYAVHNAIAHIQTDNGVFHGILLQRARAAIFKNYPLSAAPDAIVRHIVVPAGEGTQSQSRTQHIIALHLDPAGVVDGNAPGCRGCRRGIAVYAHFVSQNIDYAAIHQPETIVLAVDVVSFNPAIPGRFQPDAPVGIEDAVVQDFVISCLPYEERYIAVVDDIPLHEVIAGIVPDGHCALAVPDVIVRNQVLAGGPDQHGGIGAVNGVLANDIPVGLDIDPRTCKILQRQALQYAAVRGYGDPPLQARSLEHNGAGLAGERHEGHALIEDDLLVVLSRFDVDCVSIAGRNHSLLYALVIGKTAIINNIGSRSLHGQKPDEQGQEDDHRHSSHGQASSQGSFYS